MAELGGALHGMGTLSTQLLIADALDLRHRLAVMVDTFRPVLDPADTAPVDAYEIPQWMRDVVRLRNLADVFPYGSCTSATMDPDHTIPWTQ